MTLSSHAKRWLTSAVLLPLLIASLIVGGWAVFAWIFLATVLGLVEFVTMFRDQGGTHAWAAITALAGAAVLLVSWLCGPWWTMLALVGAFWIGAWAFLAIYGLGSQDADPRKPLMAAAGLLYIPACLQFYLHLGSWEIVFVLLAVFMSDTGAYYAGSQLGGPKLWPAVSPKKTWAGSMGGLLLSAAAALAFGLIFGHKPWPGADGSSLAPWWSWLVFAAALNVTAQLGDLFESALKRAVGVKDSGKLLPGHGGILDRMDSLIPAAPVFVALKAALLGLGAGT